MAGGISMHGVDVARGVPAQGMRVELWMMAPDSRLLATGSLNASGVWEDPLTRSELIVPGTYEARFHAGEYFAAQGSPLGILDLVPFRFVIRDPSQHYHLPLKMTPWGYSLFRGA
ncbi:hydroxyisourate hydrolase [Uliginosibacterium sediminicola]|uniref:hydroxyisourate hydrolase n=1 Tax=Uliginosibacterium sediminicola TaxID=2024550 RepID=A0ABU9YW28_9RHOO